jgi:predicted acetyltransferase
MIEIRPIVPHESDEFLRVLCEVFELDFARARGVFQREPFYDLNRKWALFLNGRMASVLTTVPVHFGDGTAIGIAGVATLRAWRGQGLAGERLDEVMSAARDSGESRGLLFARDERLYERHGFRTLDRVISQPLPRGDSLTDVGTIGIEEVKRIYTAWSESSPHILRRDEQRWQFWSWNAKAAYAWPNGYVCVELARVREMLPAYQTMPISDPLEFYGLSSMAREMGVPLTNPTPDTYLMGKDFDYVPRMFLSDQF